MDIVKQHYIVDFSSSNNFLQISAMQGDGYGVRYAELELIENGQQYTVDPNLVDVSILGTKPDTKEIWNKCEITEEGYILLEITQQMVAVPGRGEYTIIITDLAHNRQLKSFPFFIVTVPAPFDPTYIESTDEFQKLAAALIDSTRWAKVAEDYAGQAGESATKAKTSENNAKASETSAESWENLSKSYAVGTDGEVREGDATDNSKYYSELAHTSEVNAKASEDHAKESETNAKTSEINAKTSETNAKTSETNADDRANAAQGYLNQVTAAGITAVNNINQAWNDNTPHFEVDMETGLLKYQGGGYDFWVDNDSTSGNFGHLLWRQRT